MKDYIFHTFVSHKCDTCAHFTIVLYFSQREIYLFATFNLLIKPNLKIGPIFSFHISFTLRIHEINSNKGSIYLSGRCYVVIICKTSFDQKKKIDGQSMIHSTNKLFTNIRYLFSCVSHNINVQYFLTKCKKY